MGREIRNSNDEMQKESQVSTRAIIIFMIVMGAVFALFLFLIGIGVFYYGESLGREGMGAVVLVCLVCGVTLFLTGATVYDRKKKERVARMNLSDDQSEVSEEQEEAASDTTENVKNFVKKRKIILNVVRAAVLVEVGIYLLGCGAGLANIQLLALVQYGIPFLFILMEKRKPEISGGGLLCCCFLNLNTVMQLLQIRIADMWAASPYIALQAIGRYVWLLLMLATGIWLILPGNRKRAKDSEKGRIGI